MEKIKLMQGIYKLIRPTHYIKNLFVFLPLFFSAQITHGGLLWNAFLSFISFCLVASSVYIFNDIQDVEEDRLHSENKFRPIASGIIPIPLAYLFDFIFSISGLFLAYIINYRLLYVLLTYKFVNILYSLILKKIAILDILILSLGFVMRLYAGSVSTDVKLTVWIVVITFLLSMLILFGKRRNDVLFFEQNKIALRNAVKGYNSIYLNYMIILLSSVIIVAYLMYTISPEIRARLGHDYLFFTVFWVIAGILRYLQLLFVFDAKENPVKLLYKDHPLKLILLGWICTFLFFLYLF